MNSLFLQILNHISSDTASVFRRGDDDDDYARNTFIVLENVVKFWDNCSITKTQISSTKNAYVIDL